jgi:hypothetical protein
MLGNPKHAGQRKLNKNFGFGHFCKTPPKIEILRSFYLMLFFDKWSPWGPEVHLKNAHLHNSLLYFIHIVKQSHTCT